MGLRLLCTLLATSASLGCATLRAYEGPPRARAEVARLTPAILPMRQILIQSVDGRPLSVLQDRVEMLPGAHTIDVAVTLQSQTRQAYFVHRLRFSAEAGRDYTLLAELDLYGPRSYILDETTGRVVAEHLTHSRTP